MKNNNNHSPQIIRNARYNTSCLFDAGWSFSSFGGTENVIEKILEGKMKKFYSEITLLNQSFVLDPDKSVKEVINSNYKDQKFEIIIFNYLSLT